MKGAFHFEIYSARADPSIFPPSPKTKGREMLDLLTIALPKTEKPRHPLADPLEDEVWRGHQWTASFFRWLLSVQQCR